MATAKQPGRARHESFHRYWVGLIVTSVIISVVASALKGARTTEVLYRCIAVWLVLSLIGKVIIMGWSAWDDMRRGAEERK